MRASQLSRLLPELIASQGFVLLPRSPQCQALGPALLHCQPHTHARNAIQHGFSETFQRAGNLSGSLAAMLTLAGTAVAANAESHKDATPMSANSSHQQPSPLPVSETAVHPLEVDPVTNEHTAKMTMARTAALEYYQAGKYRMAEAKFLEALEEARLGFDAKDPHIASAQNNLAEFYRNTGQHAKAEQLYKEALQLLESIYGERHWLYVSAMHNLALSYEAAGDLSAAETTMEQVMNLRLHMFGARHFLYADSMFALGHILLKQAAVAAQPPQSPPAAGGSSSQGGSQSGGWMGGWWGGRKRAAGNQRGATALERRGLQLMQDAITILEDAESVQVNVVLGWLEELSLAYRARDRLSDALKCVTKALWHFSNDKGEAHAHASQLADERVELLLGLGDMRGARDAAAACLSARQQLFGRDLTVAQSELRLATLEVQLGKAADIGAALQHARNAATLSQELLGEYSRASVGNWLGGAGQDKSVKRARAAHIAASALKFTAQHAPQQQQQHSGGSSATPGGSSTAVNDLEAAVAVLQSSISASQQQLKRLSASGARPGPPGGGGSGAGGGVSSSSTLSELADVYVDLQLLLLECVEALIAVLTTQSSSSNGGGEQQQQQVRARVEQLEKLQQDLATELLG